MRAQGMYDPSNEHDACGVGFIAHIKGVKTHSVIEQGLLILKNLDHRGAVGADKLMGDGAGILIQVPDQFYREEMALGLLIGLERERRGKEAGRRPDRAGLARCAGRCRDADVADRAQQGAVHSADFRRPRP